MFSRTPRFFLPRGPVLAMLLAAALALVVHVRPMTKLWFYDLTGDGIPEKLVLLEVVPETYTLYVEQDGTVLWRSYDLARTHPGYGSYFLYQNGGTTAILEYNPAMWQGLATYTYKLFDLSNGQETILAQNETDFSLWPIGGEPWSDKNQAFADEVNTLMDHSTLLVSTLEGNLCIGGPGSPWHCVPPEPEE